MRLFTLPFFLIALHAQGGAQPSEADYVRRINGYFQGETEVTVEGGRADIVTDTYAIEVEWAPKWKHAIGQALWYALQTNRRPGIVLLPRPGAGRKDYRHLIRLQSTLDYAGLSGVRVWIWPDDFVDWRGEP